MNNHHPLRQVPYPVNQMMGIGSVSTHHECFRRGSKHDHGLGKQMRRSYRIGSNHILYEKRKEETV
ncbi:hypothetical protein EA58_08655 [Photobacterium galatheae]|uniref:Uncharacterized protein n=1 Tax=Photobacterium galatheae TaxID=1654360 RepID=A0A066RW96_9GAMM|nr:hypothetical protein EA58_08655 [Photobacterium galatheae]